MALSSVVSEILNVKKCRDLEIRSEVTQGHWADGYYGTLIESHGCRIERYHFRWPWV